MPAGFMPLQPSVPFSPSLLGESPYHRGRREKGGRLAVRIIDLSHDIYEGMFKFPGAYHPKVEMEQTGFYERDKCVVHKLVLGTHTGTHIDAPYHFFADGRTIDQIPLEWFVAEAVVFDLSGKGPGEPITEEEVDVSKVGEGEVALIKTGWYKRWGKDFYQNPPKFSVELARKLVERGVVALAVDIPLDHDVHRVVLGAGRLLIENLTNLDEVRPGRLRLLALPLKIRGGDASPARVLAIIED